jgi:hypothetical protein
MTLSNPLLSRDSNAARKKARLEGEKPPSGSRQATGRPKGRPAKPKVVRPRFKIFVQQEGQLQVSIIQIGGRCRSAMFKFLFACFRLSLLCERDSFLSHLGQATPKALKINKKKGGHPEHNAWILPAAEVFAAKLRRDEEYRRSIGVFACLF